MGLTPFDLILVTTKDISDVSPTVADIIEPAVTPGRTAIVLSQNGINIEKPVTHRFPSNPIISSISFIGATERSHDDPDVQTIGPFDSSEFAMRYGTLFSISAFYLSNEDRDHKRNDEAANWGTVASRYRCDAIGLLKCAVETDLYADEKIKYKEFLATMLSMVTINVIYLSPTRPAKFLVSLANLSPSGNVRRHQYMWRSSG